MAISTGFLRPRLGLALGLERFIDQLRRQLEVENLFLRHQLNIALRRAPRRLQLRGSDRALLVWMSRLWPSLLRSERTLAMLRGPCGRPGRVRATCFLGVDSLIGVFGPRGMSSALGEGIADDIKAIVAADPTIATRLEATGQVVDIPGPTEFATGIKEMRDQLASIAQTLEVKAAE